jgi:hypothetical protein
MRSDPIPCKHATDYEIARESHLTWNEDGICNPCMRLLDVFTMKRANAAANERLEEAHAAEEAREAAQALHPSSWVPDPDGD